jgi:hypothetical protein
MNAIADHAGDASVGAARPLDEINHPRADVVKDEPSHYNSQPSASDSRKDDIFLADSVIQQSSPTHHLNSIDEEQGRSTVALGVQADKKTENGGVELDGPNESFTPAQAPAIADESTVLDAPIVDEQQLESLARSLAENLHKEHLSPSIYNFEEFEREQETMRLQHYLHQQEVQHQQQAYREEYLHQHWPGHRDDLTIQVDATQYSANPSPSAYHYYAQQEQELQMQVERANQTQLPWYYADEAPVYENFEGTPCSRRDRLYEVGLTPSLYALFLLSVLTFTLRRPCRTNTKSWSSLGINTFRGSRTSPR